jgi:hypothetical protein
MITLTGVGTVSFRNPDLANKYALDTGIIQKYTRGQKVIVYKDTNWKSIETEILVFQHIRETKRVEIQNFLQNNLGSEISITKPRRDDCTIVDHVFTGYIYSDVIDYRTLGEDGCARLYTFGLVLLYKITLADVGYLLAESGSRLITEAGDRIKTEAG